MGRQLPTPMLNQGRGPWRGWCHMQVELPCQFGPRHAGCQNDRTGRRPDPGGHTRCAPAPCRTRGGLRGRRHRGGRARHPAGRAGGGRGGHGLPEGRGGAPREASRPAARSAAPKGGSGALQGSRTSLRAAKDLARDGDRRSACGADREAGIPALPGRHRRPRAQRRGAEQGPGHGRCQLRSGRSWGGGGDRSTTTRRTGRPSSFAGRLGAAGCPRAWHRRT